MFKVSDGHCSRTLLPLARERNFFRSLTCICWALCVKGLSRALAQNLHLRRRKLRGIAPVLSPRPADLIFNSQVLSPLAVTCGMFRRKKQERPYYCSWDLTGYACWPIPTYIAVNSHPRECRPGSQHSTESTFLGSLQQDKDHPGCPALFLAPYGTLFSLLSPRTPLATEEHQRLLLLWQTLMQAH